MNRNKIKKDNKFICPINEYVVTTIVTIFLIFIVCFVIQFELMTRIEKVVTIKELNTANLSKFYTIEQLEKKFKTTPDDYVLNINLAYMYETIEDYDKANEFYKNALTLSKRNNYSLYSYAMFCARRGLLIYASTLAEQMTGTNRQTNFFKAKIYELIADSLSKEGKYQASIKAYQIVYKYLKSINLREYTEKIEDKYQKEFVKLADYNVEIKETKEAISNLKNSIKIKKNAIAYYKLALIYMPIDSKTSHKYLQKAFKMQPYLVNPYVYNSVLNNMLNEAKALEDKSLYNFYNTKINNFKNKLEKMYLYKGNITIENSKISVKKGLFGKNKYILLFDLKNNTHTPIKNLSIKTEIYIKGQKYAYEVQPVHRTHVLDGLDSVKNIEINLPKSAFKNQLFKDRDIFVRYYAKKTSEAPWMLLKIAIIKF